VNSLGLGYRVLVQMEGNRHIRFCLGILFGLEVLCSNFYSSRSYHDGNAKVWICWCLSYSTIKWNVFDLITTSNKFSPNIGFLLKFSFVTMVSLVMMTQLLDFFTLSMTTLHGEANLRDDGCEINLHGACFKPS
jgi:hypothetical protein